MSPANVLQPGLLQHALRRLVVPVRNADDSVEAEIVETIIDECLRAFRRKASAPCFRQ
jgi:hypothetical protein